MRALPGVSLAYFGETAVGNTALPLRAAGAAELTTFRDVVPDAALGAGLLAAVLAGFGAGLAAASCAPPHSLSQPAR